MSDTDEHSSSLVTSVKKCKEKKFFNSGPNFRMPRLLVKNHFTERHFDQHTQFKKRLVNQLAVKHNTHVITVTKQ